MSTFSKRILASGETSGPQRVIHHICLCVISGEMTLYIEDRKQSCSSGSFVNISANTPHVFRNESNAPLVLVCIAAPLPKGIDPRRDMNRVTVRSSSDVPVVAVVGDAYALLFEGADTDQSYALVEARVPAGGGPPPHIHTREVEAFFILEGIVDFMVAGKNIRACAGEILEVPVGTLHAFKNNTKDVSSMLIAVAPSGLEQMFREVGSLMKSFSETPPHPTPDDIGKLLATAAKYGIEIKIPH
jgi:mannose-6-phosphate isomerase-like protein (cupin superfamily)